MNKSFRLRLLGPSVLPDMGRYGGDLGRSPASRLRNLDDSVAECRLEYAAQRPELHTAPPPAAALAAAFAAVPAAALAAAACLERHCRAERLRSPNLG